MSDFALRKRRSDFFAVALAFLAIATAVPVEARAANRVAKNCSALAGAAIEARSIGLPTGGAIVSSSVPMDARAGIGAYCLISGDIKPVDREAPNIKFQVALPDAWNGKALMLGGGGFDGRIPSLTSPSAMWGASKAAVPLGRGYAVFGSDSGHQSQERVPPGAFGSNVEALRNYAGDALKKTRDVAIALIVSRYGRPPIRFYFIGYSKGGGEALTVLQRWPSDWDGVVAGAPGWNVTAVSLNMLRASQALAEPGAWLNEAKRNTLYKAALSACDELDGAKDGIISNVQACAVQFDPASAKYNGAPLGCPNGADLGDACLSRVQLAALKQINEPTPLSYPLGSGEISLPGYPVYIADNGGGVADAPQKAMVSSIGVFASAAPAFPPNAQMSSAWKQADGFIRYVVVQNPDFNPLTMNIETANGTAASFLTASALDANIADLTPFMKRGGKLLLWTGAADMSISPRATEYFLSRVQSAMGPGQVDTFLRYYEIPGGQHGPSTVFQPEWDQLTAIENWVEKNVDPDDNLTVRDGAGIPGRTRPMCRFPTWPKYRGSGDINLAASFKCASS